MRQVDLTIIKAAKRLYDGAKEEGGCLIPHLKPNLDGYVRVELSDKPRRSGERAHRVIYEFHHGPIPADLTIDHTCHDPEVCAGGPTCPHRRCIQIKHLEAVPLEENIRRGASANARKTHCPKGHPLDEANTYIDTANRRRCRKCLQEKRSGSTP